MVADELLRVEVRPPRPGEGAGIATAHIRSWQVAYRGIFPDDYLDGLTGELTERSKRWERFIERDAPIGRLLVALVDRTVVAFSSFGPAGAVRDHTTAPPVPPARLGEVYGFYTHPDYWRLGVGRALMGRSIDALATTYDHAILWVLQENPPARRFYEAMGWRPTGEVSIFQRERISAPEVRYDRPLRDADP